MTEMQRTTTVELKARDIEPLSYASYEADKCPNAGNKCILVNDGRGAFACRTCGTGFFLETGETIKGLVPFDWHGPYPWER